MNTAMYDAREALAAPRATPRPSPMERGPPGSTHAQSSLSSGGRERAERGPVARHDPLTYIGPDRQAAATPSNLHIPVGIFMNMAHVPPRFYNQHQQMLVAAQGKERAAAPPQASSAAASKRLGGKAGGRRPGESQLSQGGSQDISQVRN